MREPRLVRLNPNVPWKTRGNAALAVHFGHGFGARRRVGHLPEGEVVGFARSSPLRACETDDLVTAAWRAVRSSCSSGEPGTDPSLVVAPHRLSARLYWNAVRRVVDPEEVDRELDQPGVLVLTEGSGRGRIGAAAALAWPGGHPTWELVAYRDPSRWGTPRAVDPLSVERAARRHPELFLCSDPRSRRMLVAPHTPCPVLFGLRASRPEPLVTALEEVLSEPVSRWLLFRTNQGTGDHVRSPIGPQLTAHLAGTLEGHVDGLPESLRGGHVRFRLRRPGLAAVTCLAFAPARTLPRVARSLLPGDRVRLWGGCSADLDFHVEGIELLAVERAARPGLNPLCPACGRRTRSLGAGRGFGCRPCSVRLPSEARSWVPVPRPFPPGRYHPAPSARRHLAPRGPESVRPVGQMG